jgi:uncharacterized damage-inducible protein DinB
MTDIGPRLQANRDLLDQALELLERLSDDQYARRRGDWAPVGAQYRHVLEHYQCFFAGLASGRVDYDGRKRDVELERSRESAAAATRRLRADLDGLRPLAPTRPLRVQLRTTTAAAGPEWSESTVARELQFLVSHTVHHFALIKLLLTPDRVALDPDFGVAPSTLAYARPER